MSPALSVTEITTGEDFLGLRDEWSALVDADERATIFQTWEFQYFAWKMNSDAVRPHLVLVRDETGRMIGCAPLATWEWRIGPARAQILGFNGGRYVDYNDVVVVPKRAADVVARIGAWLQEAVVRWDVVYLRQVRETAWLLSHKANLSGALTVPVEIEPVVAAPYLTFGPEWKGYGEALNKKRAKTVAYEIRRLFRDLPDARFVCVENEADLDEALSFFFALHQKRMLQKRQLGVFRDRQVREGFRELVRVLSGQGMATLAEIRSGNSVIASVCAFEFRNTVSYYQGGYDPEHSRLSPGSVLQALRIDKAIEDGCVEYDFLAGDESYKAHWASGERKLYDLDFAKKSWRRSVFRGWKRLYAGLTRSDRLRDVYLHLRPARRVPPSFE